MHDWSVTTTATTPTVPWGVTSASYATDVPWVFTPAIYVPAPSRVDAEYLEVLVGGQEAIDRQRNAKHLARTRAAVARFLALELRGWVPQWLRPVRGRVSTAPLGVRRRKRRTCSMADRYRVTN